MQADLSTYGLNPYNSAPRLNKTTKPKPPNPAAAPTLPKYPEGAPRNSNSKRNPPLDVAPPVEPVPEYDPNLNMKDMDPYYNWHADQLDHLTRPDLEVDPVDDAAAYSAIRSLEESAEAPFLLSDPSKFPGGFDKNARLKFYNDILDRNHVNKPGRAQDLVDLSFKPAAPIGPGTGHGDDLVKRRPQL